ncbi:unnamed protein product [Cuscuta campestris]|uniref:RIN4 pathogenic type III effector avirulence factor Avr cleavage site domain-containing protein n=2 Tax=Cuscuta sect. Cleistogrammica TaxID=1824901 RepID=A0A484KRR4_9ASTE|nr:hypothetical protein DM860_009281 [Cuscuta australis]VFQ64742.1 unnamed protein product [Cuscuta campestris]VFQ83581.1 unnamed protein product [Cuscuta campestris]
MAAIKSKRSGQIPAFGEWEAADRLPITQCFGNAPQASLSGYSRESATAVVASHFRLPPPPSPAAADIFLPSSKMKRYSLGGRAQPRKPDPDALEKNRSGSQKPFLEQSNASKPVDEDLYQIPPELLRSGNRKKFFGFFSRCLAPRVA